MGEGGHSHLWLLLAPSVHHCVTDGRETRVGVGVSPSQGGEAAWFPRAAPHRGRGPEGNGLRGQAEVGKGWGEGSRKWEVEEEKLEMGVGGA